MMADPFPARSIIVMKGYPFTRKTEFARIIARSLSCPVLSLESLLDDLTPPLSLEQEFEAFKVICQIAFHHLHSEIFENVVIDSPLSSKSHFIHLMDMVVKYLFTKGHKRVIVVECKPSNTYSWKLKLEEHLALRTLMGDEVKWYKPKRWEDVEKTIEEHPDYDVTTVSLIQDIVSKLVVDPLLDCLYICSFSDGTYFGTHSFIEAVKYLMTRDGKDGQNIVVYQQWLQQSKSQSKSITPHGEEHCSAHGHDIVPSSTLVEGIQHEIVDCMACERQVIRRSNNGHAYCYCKKCSLTLHMECALSCNYFGGIQDPCNSCTGVDKDFSMECKTCEFQNHLREGTSPIAIEHSDTKDHFLTVLLENNYYICLVCGEKSESKGMYLCKDCGVAYHYDCIKLPRRVKNVHGAHHHHLSLKFESEEAEDYICQECLEFRDPTLWYYSCEECPGYELHPSCVAKLSALTWSRKHYGDEMNRTYKAETEAAETIVYGEINMKASESVWDFYSREIHLIQWYGDPRREAELFKSILRSLPLKFYHIVVAIERSKEFESMTVDQLMISLRVFEKRIDNGEDVLIEHVLANLYWDKYRESGDNWAKYWGRFWDKYWFNYQRRCNGKGRHRRQDRSKVQCSICKMFGHNPRRCWMVSSNVKKKKLKIKSLTRSLSSQRRLIVNESSSAAYITRMEFMNDSSMKFLYILKE